MQPSTKQRSKPDIPTIASRLWRTTISRYPVVVLLLVVVGVISGLQQKTFFTGYNLLNVARTFSWLSIAAFGESLVIIIGGIDLSVGAVMGLAGLIGAHCMQIGLPVPLSIIAGLATGGLVGWLNGTVIARVKLPPFIVTLGMMSVVRGLTFGISRGWPVTDLPEGFRFLGQNDLMLGTVSLPLPLIFASCLAALVALLTQQTILGRYIYTLSDSERALRISGVDVDRVKVATYTLCGLLTAISGMLMTARLGVATPTAATGYELHIIAAALVGGTSLFGGKGSTLGVILGTAFVQMLRSALVLWGFPAYWQGAAMGAMLLLAISLDYWRHESSPSWNWQGFENAVRSRLKIARSLRGSVAVLVPIVVLLIVLVVWQIRDQKPNNLPPTGSADQETLTIAWIPKALNNPVFELGRQGAVQKAAELSENGPIQVKVLYAGSVSSDAAEQMQVIEGIAALNVDAIAVSCNDPVACIDPINRAVTAGIPVMTWDADSPQSWRFAHLGIDNYQAGQAAADLLVRAMGPEGEVAILTGVPGAYNLEKRVRGFRDRIALYPYIQIVATAVSNDDINLGVQAVEETMRAHPNLDGWFFVGMWPLFADRGSMPLWEEAVLSGDTKTVAFDTLPIELDLLRDGYLSGLVGQEYWGWGYNTVQVIYDHIVNDKTYPSFVNSGIDIVTSNNVDAMIQAWETNDFSRPLPDPY